MNYLHEFHGHEFEALLLESLDNLANQSSLDSIRLDHNEGSLLISRHD